MIFESGKEMLVPTSVMAPSDTDYTGSLGASGD